MNTDSVNVTRKQLRLVIEPDLVDGRPFTNDEVIRNIVFGKFVACQEPSGPSAKWDIKAHLLVSTGNRNLDYSSELLFQPDNLAVSISLKQQVDKGASWLHPSAEHTHRTSKLATEAALEEDMTY